VAGTDFALHIAAYGQTPNDPVCGIIESYTGPKNLKFWFSFANPGSGSISPTIEAVAIPAIEASAADQPVTFTNGQAAVTGKYKDVGRIQINVKDDSQPHPDLPTGIRGATAGFVVKPYQFVLSDIEDGAGNPNPAAVDASGGTFVAAGEPFSITVTAIDAEGDVTPNYGQEAISESVALASNLLAPLGGDNPVIASGFSAFVAGQAMGTTFSWPEVGIIALNPSIGDGDYLGAGDVSGTASENVGRFYAHHFTTSLNTPTFATSCASGSFSYIGEIFGYSNQPVITLTARALAGEVAENYVGGFFKVDSSSLTVPVYTSTPTTLDSTGMPAGDPLIAPTGAGTGTLTFGSTGGLFYTRGTEEPPFDADIRLSIDVADTDGAAASNPIVFGTAGGMLFDSGAEMRYGRGRLQNAYGSELVNLAVPFRTEYFVDAATGFVPNVDDSCTSPVSLSFIAFTDNLASGETCVFDSGAPGSSSIGCAAPGPLALRYRAPPIGGDFNIHLQAPGETNDGSTTIRADVPDWLEFDWDNALPGLEDPVGTAVFGIFSGSDRRIYLRELY
jgi:MSHA biogenesis protein MshQ